jgi:hypothetical protein
MSNITVAAIMAGVTDGAIMATATVGAITARVIIAVAMVIPTQAMPILIIILMPILPLTSASVSVGAVGNFAASSCSGGSWRNWIEAGDASGRKPPRMPWP